MGLTKYDATEILTHAQIIVSKKVHSMKCRRNARNVALVKFVPTLEPLDWFFNGANSNFDSDGKAGNIIFIGYFYDALKFGLPPIFISAIRVVDLLQVSSCSNLYYGR